MSPDPAETFDISSEGPFNAVQKRLGLIREGQRNIGRRALLFVLIAWGMPLVLSVFGGPGAGLPAMQEYLGELPIWARYFLAIALFVIMEKQAGAQLRDLVQQLFNSPILSPASRAAASEAVAQAVGRLGSQRAEWACLVAAVAVSWILYYRLAAMGDFSWARQPGEAGAYMTAAGWWVIAVSNPLFSFLLFRWLWRFVVWCGLLKSLARLEMRLVSTHPDGRGGMGFIGAYPNAFLLLVLAIGSVIGSVLATQLVQGSLQASLWAYVMGVWLFLVLAAFCAPLLPFNKPLARLKHATLVKYDGVATRYFRATERSMLGENVVAADEDDGEMQATPDPSKTMLLVNKQSVTLIHFRKLLPTQLAALLPLAAAGAAFLPLKEILSLLKKILLF